MRRAGFVFDLIVIVIFVAIGRSAHGHQQNVGGFLSTTWPFATGLVISWLILTVRSQSPLTKTSGALVCVVTVVIGMLLRVIAGQGTAFAFILVALGFLGAAMIGWRLIVQMMQRSSPAKVTQ